MTELAAGAVSSLLLVVRNEQLLLGGVKDDVQFIKEEMESMKSFLAHLARSTPPGGEHDEQVRTWMTQVRLLAQDCHNCIDLYLYSGNHHIHRAKGRLRRYLWWAYWFLRKLFAQHRAAVQLRQLKDRARHVGERRLRYGVEVPSKSAASLSAVAGGYAAGDDEDDGDDDHLAVGARATTDHSTQTRALFSRGLDDYVKAKILEWRNLTPGDAGETMSFVMVAPDKDRDIITLVRETSVFQDPDFEYQRDYDLTILIDITALHMEFLPLGPKEVLFYILRQLKLELHSQSQYQKQGTDQVEGEEEVLGFWQLYNQKRSIYYEKRYIYYEKETVLYKINENMQKMKICEKLDEIKSGLKTRPPKSPHKGMDEKDTDVHALLQQLLWSYVPASQQDQMMKNKNLPKLSASDDTIKAVAMKLRKHVEVRGGGEIVEEREGGKETVEEPRGGVNDTDEKGDGSYDDDESEEEEKKIYLHDDQYVHILQQVFPNSSSSNRSSYMQEGKDDKIQETCPNTKAIFSDIVDQKMDKIKQEFEEQMKIKGLVDDIKGQLEDKWPLFILKIDETVDLRRWEDTRNALSLLACSADVLIVTTAKDIQQAKEYSYPQSEPIDYSLAGLYYDTVLEIIKQQKNEENYNPQIFRNILEQCEPYESCMKIFAHALYTNPKRSNEELNKLHKNLLQASPNSSDVIAKKMFKFSYTDMPKEYKSCLLYLAIYPPAYKIRRSTLIGRWVAEGLIFKEDWPSSVHWANRCFDELINRCLADPAEIGAAGKVKSCVVSDLVHGFITEMARKQHILETRLSHHLARHFSIFNDLQLRSSDKIDGFFQSLSKSSRLSLLKVLDLEGCQCFIGGKNERYLEDICSKMLLLKYLSLRGTEVTRLPSTINNLRELEVLDIRQTNVSMNTTANILLLKLKRLLAGNTDRTPRPTLRAEESESITVQIPHKIVKMVNMEVLSNVKARSSRDLKDIGKLWQLRKLGVVVDNDSSYLKNLLRAISDLHECLYSLSITLPTDTSQELPEVSLKLKHQPKLLESLSISGTTQKGFLPLFVKDVNSLVKVTLSRTSLSQNNLKDLARLPKLQLIRFHHIAFTNSNREIIFKKDTFISLKYLLVEGPTFTKVSFMNEADCMLEKMVLSFTNIESVSGVEGLKKLEEVELTMSMSSSNEKKNDTLLSSFNNGKQIAKLTLVGMHEQGDQQIQSMIKFNKGEFEKLRLLTVDCPATKVVFTNGSAPKLEKIVWSSSTSLCRIKNLSRLKELEFNGDLVPKVVEEASKKHKNKPNLKHNKPEIQGQAKGDDQEEEEEENDDAGWFPFCWKKQV